MKENPTTRLTTPRTAATFVAAALTAVLMAGCGSAPFSSKPAQQAPMGAAHAGHDAQRAAPSGAQQAYEKSMMSMHDDMMRGIAHQDPDTAFAAGMLPHHQGAVDMARIELQYGKDPELRRLAQDIIDAQQKEIAQLQRWLKNNAKP